MAAKTKVKAESEEKEKPRDPFLVRLGQRIKMARKKAGLKQRELAARIHVSEPTISGWETGKHAMELKHLSDFAWATRTPVSFIVPSPEPETYGEQSLAEELIAILEYRRLLGLLSVPEAELRREIDLLIGQHVSRGGVIRPR